MKRRSLLDCGWRGLLLGSIYAAGLPLMSSAAESNAIRLYVNAKESLLFRTAETATPTVTWETPADATAAELTIAGMDGTETVDVTGLSQRQLSFAEPTSEDAENVYRLTLRFTCPGGDVTKTAQLGVVCGRGDGGSAAAWCVLRGDKGWTRYRANRAVLPVPAGTMSLSVDGEAVETELAGAAGWYGWRPALKPGKAPTTLTLAGPWGVYANDVLGGIFGAVLLVR